MQLPAQLTTLPNLLTLARIVAIPVICVFVVIGWPLLQWLALLLFVAAAVTDWIDGYLARRMDLSSAIGRMLDPIADKLLVGALLVTLAWTRQISALDLIPAIAILLREIFVAGLREYLGGAGITVPVTFLAKWKTTVQLVALALLLAAPVLLGLALPAQLALWLAALLTVWTGWEYLRSSWPHLQGPPL
jgi:CDP-diacylglycerol--glycerol-3-phosphate 3-phosphatidyltransferase